MIGLRMCQCQDQEGATDSLFVTTERCLANAEWQKAVRRVAPAKKMARYRTMIDFLFCEIYTEYRPACFEFYLDRGPPLREILTANEVAKFDRWLRTAAWIAWRLAARQCRFSWNEYVKAVVIGIYDLAAVAAGRPTLLQIVSRLASRSRRTDGRVG